jgi:hypothetical protein
MYLIARVQLRYGSTERFGAALTRLRPIVARHGWRLEAAYVNIVGPLAEVLDIWEVPSADSVATTLAVLEADPEFATIRAELVDVILHEETTLSSKAPFSP